MTVLIDEVFILVTHPHKRFVYLFLMFKNSRKFKKNQEKYKNYLLTKINYFIIFSVI